MRVMIQFQLSVVLYILQSHIVGLSSSLRLGPTSLTVEVLAVIHIFLFQAYTYTLLPSRREAQKRSFLNQGLAAAKAYIHSQKVDSLNSFWTEGVPAGKTCR